MDSEILFVKDYRRTHPLTTTVDDTRTVYPKLSWWNSVRLKVVVLIFFCVFCSNLLRINLNVALPFMVNDTTTTIVAETNFTTTTNFLPCEPVVGSYPGAYLFDWPISIQTLLLAATLWGEGFGILPAAYLAKNRGCKSVLTVAVGVSSLIAIFVPSAAFFGVYYIIILRFFTGFALSFVFPGILTVVKSWIPQKERAKVLFAIALGYALSHFLWSPIVVLLCAIPNNYGGWPIVFYVAAIFGFIWVVCWTLTIANKPDRHLAIGRNEKYYISDRLKEDIKESAVVEHKFSNNWRRTLLSVSVFIAILNHFAFFSAFRFVESVLLIYLKRGLYISVPNILLGIFDSVQYFTFAVFLFLFNFATKAMIDKFSCSLASGMEVFAALGSLSFGFGLMILPFVQCYRPWWLLVFLCLIYALIASYGRSYISVIFRYVHFRKYWTVLIVSEAVANLGGAFFVTLAGLLQQFTDYSWWSCFAALGVLLIFSGFITLIHCSVYKSKSKNLPLNTETEVVPMKSTNGEQFPKELNSADTNNTQIN